MTREAELEKLLSMLFPESGELRRWLSGYEATKAIVDELPGVTASKAAVVHRAVQVLAARRLVHEVLGALAEDPLFKGRQVEILDTGKAWTGAQQRGTSAPIDDAAMTALLEAHQAMGRIVENAHSVLRTCSGTDARADDLPVVLFHRATHQGDWQALEAARLKVELLLPPPHDEMVSEFWGILTNVDAPSRDHQLEGRTAYGMNLELVRRLHTDLKAALGRFRERYRSILRPPTSTQGTHQRGSQQVTNFDAIAQQFNINGNPTFNFNNDK